MITQNSISTQKLAKKWPYKFLNFLPGNKQYQFLNWKSRTFNSTEMFNFRIPFQKMEKGIILLPDHLGEIFLSLPLLSFFIKQCGNTNITVLCTDTFTNIISGFFKEIAILEINKNEYFLETKHFKNLTKKVSLIQADFFIQMNIQTNMLNLFLQKASQAKLKLNLGKESYPFANLNLMATAQSNIFQLYQEIVNYWKNQPSASLIKQLSIKADISYTKEIKQELVHARINEKKICLFLWDDNPRNQQWQSDCIQKLERAMPGDFQLALVLPDTLKKNTLVLHGREKSIPYFQNLSLGKMISLFFESSHIIGLHTPMIHLANYCGKKVTGLYVKEDKPFDTSLIFKKFHIKYIDTNAEFDGNDII